MVVAYLSGLTDAPFPVWAGCIYYRLDLGDELGNDATTIASQQYLVYRKRERIRKPDEYG